MSKYAKLCQSALLAGAVMVAVPAVSHAQIVIGGGSGGSASISLGGAGVKAKENVPKMVSADSLAKLRTYAKTKEPVIVIDGAVTTLKALEVLPDSQIVSAVFQQGDAEVRHYGKKAENGVLILKTGKAAKDAKATKGATTELNNIEFKIENGGSIQMKQ